LLAPTTTNRPNCFATGDMAGEIARPFQESAKACLRAT
jgi:hypothetical protein